MLHYRPLVVLQTNYARGDGEVIAANIESQPSEEFIARRWTALELFTAVAPDRVGRLPNPQSAFIAETRRAHAVALANGYRWDAHGRYPLDIWMKALQ